MIQVGAYFLTLLITLGIFTLLDAVFNSNERSSGEDN
jgi:hypothetical protein